MQKLGPHPLIIALKGVNQFKLISRWSNKSLVLQFRVTMLLPWKLSSSKIKISAEHRVS